MTGVQTVLFRSHVRSMTVDTPQGKCCLESDNWRLISSMVETFNYANSEGKNIVDAVKYARQAYKQSYSHKPPRQVTVVQRGVENEFILGYLYGWTDLETLGWVYGHKKVKLSKSAIGRYWKRLHKAGIFPLY